MGARADLLLTSTRTSTPIAVQPAAGLRSGDPAVVEAGTPPGRRHDRVRGQSARPIGTLVTIAVGRRHKQANSEGRTSPDACFLGEQERRARRSSRPPRVRRRRVLPRDRSRPPEFVRALAFVARHSSDSGRRARESSRPLGADLVAGGLYTGLSDVRSPGGRSTGIAVVSGDRAVLTGMAGGSCRSLVGALC